MRQPCSSKARVWYRCAAASTPGGPTARISDAMRPARTAATSASRADAAEARKRDGGALDGDGPVADRDHERRDTLHGTFWDRHSGGRRAGRGSAGTSQAGYQPEHIPPPGGGRNGSAGRIIRPVSTTTLYPDRWHQPASRGAREGRPRHPVGNPSPPGAGRTPPGPASASAVRARRRPAAPAPPPEPSPSRPLPARRASGTLPAPRRAPSAGREARAAHTPLSLPLSAALPLSLPLSPLPPARSLPPCDPAGSLRAGS